LNASEESLKPRDYETAKRADRPWPKGKWVGSPFFWRGRRHPRHSHRGTDSNRTDPDSSPSTTG